MYSYFINFCRLTDTKSNSKITLMNYIVGQIEQNHKELLDIETEIGNVKGAAKVRCGQAFELLI